MKIKISSGNFNVEAELKDTRTAHSIFQNLPVKGKVNRWGDEIYFTIPVALDLEDDSRDVLEVGELGYWPQGHAFAILFGKTPNSKGEEPRTASNVNVFGKLVKVDVDALRNINDGDEILVEQVE